MELAEPLALVNIVVGDTIFPLTVYEEFQTRRLVVISAMPLTQTHRTDLGQQSAQTPVAWFASKDL